MFRALRIALVASVLLLGAPARAAGDAFDVPALSAADQRTLDRGAHVTRPFSFHLDGRKYVGGVAYQVVDVEPDEVLRRMSTAESIQKALPHTRRVEIVDRQGDATRVELVQGTSVMEATYTVYLVRDVAEKEIHFWLDATRPHDVDDVRGYLRIRPFGPGRSLVTVGVAVDLGPGLVRLFFEPRLQRSVLRTPVYIKRYVEGLARRSAPAPWRLAKGGL